MSDKFKDTMYVTVYALAREGMPDEQIGLTLGVAGQTFRNWCARRPALRDALKRGRAIASGSDGGKEFREYVYDHLPENLQKLWDEINACEKLRNGVDRVRSLLERGGVHARQHLFLYALTQYGFNVSRAVQKVAISRKTYEDWVAHDPGFAELVDEIHWHKQNFFENAFLDLVSWRNPAAVIHGVKTQCRERGYNEKIEVEHSGSVELRNTVNLTDLDLDLETRKKILDALKRKNAADGVTGE